MMKIKESVQMIIFIYVRVDFKKIIMDEYLKLLITHYEFEQQNLQSFLDDCLSQEDYKFAKYYLEHLRFLQKTLFKLYRLLDYNHAEKAALLNRLSNINSLK